MSATAMDQSAQMELLESLLQLSVNLSVVNDRQDMLDMILAESRRISNAQAGSLYIRCDKGFEFAIAQNDVVDITNLSKNLLGETLGVGENSLVGFTTATGRIVNIPDSHNLTDGTPFRIDREFDSTTGYRTRSILAIPLKCPDGEIAGVLQLINRLDSGGAVVPFPEPERQPIMSLASMAAVSIQNAPPGRQAQTGAPGHRHSPECRGRIPRPQHRQAYRTHKPNQRFDSKGFGAGR